MTWCDVCDVCDVCVGVQEEDQQRHCLQLGREAGIDIVMATKAVVENIMKSAEQVSMKR